METAAPTCGDGGTADAAGSNPATHECSNPSPCISLYHREGVNNTAYLTKASLQRLREAAKMTRKEAAPLLGMSEETLRRLETVDLDRKRDQQPTSGDLARMEVVYRAPGLWYNFQHSNDDAFRDHLPELPEYNAQGALMAFFVESTEAAVLEKEALRDAADGKIDDRDLKRRIIKEVEDVAAAAILLLQKLKEG